MTGGHHRHLKGQAHSHNDRDRQTNRQLIEVDRQLHGQKDGQTNSQTGSQTDSQID